VLAHEALCIFNVHFESTAYPSCAVRAGTAGTLATAHTTTTTTAYTTAMTTTAIACPATIPVITVTARRIAICRQSEVIPCSSCHYRAVLDSDHLAAGQRIEQKPRNCAASQPKAEKTPGEVLPIGRKLQVS
jgi:hypothetical protein